LVKIILLEKRSSDGLKVGERERREGEMGENEREINLKVVRYNNAIT
jgi:hypothetical protein